MIGGCCVCLDDRGYDENPIVYCDGSGCSVAVHQGFILKLEKFLLFNILSKVIAFCSFLI